MKYRSRKVVFTIFAVLFGVMMLPAIITTVGTNGPIAFPIVVGVIFLLFLILAIYNRNQDQHYWPPKNVEGVEPTLNDSLVNDVYSKIKIAFPELPLKNNFLFNKEIFDKLHLECRKMAPSQFTIQSVANEMWRHMGLDTEVPTIYLSKKETTYNPFETGGIAGLASTNYNERSLLVSYSKGYTADSIICLLAHELAHFYQFDNKKVFEGAYGEIITDAMTAFFGFENSFVFGRNYSYGERVSLNSTMVHSGKIGYIKDEDYKKIIYLVRNDAPIKTENKEENIHLIKTKFIAFKTVYDVRHQLAEMNAKMPPIVGNYHETGKAYKEFLESVSISELEQQVNDLETNYTKEKFEALNSFFIADEMLYKAMMPEDKKR